MKPTARSIHVPARGGFHGFNAGRSAVGKTRSFSRLRQRSSIMSLRSNDSLLAAVAAWVGRGLWDPWPSVSPSQEITKSGDG